MPDDSKVAPPNARRVFGAVALIMLVTVGLSVRAMRGSLPSTMSAIIPDAAWAAAVYALLTLVRPCWSSVRLATASAAFALFMELTQLYHGPWIDAIRATRLGGLILGYGFLWSDLACYALGIGAMLALDLCLSRRR